MTKKIRARALFCVILVVSGLLGTARGATSGAEKLIDRLPDETIFFIATSGGDELKPAFEKTILGKLWYDAETQNFYNSVKTEIINKIKQDAKDPNEMKIPEKILGFVELVLQRPFVFGAVKNTAGKDIPMAFFAIVDAGTKKDQIAKALSEIEAFDKEKAIKDIEVAGEKMHWILDNEGVGGYWGWVENYLICAINDEQGISIKNIKAGGSGKNYLADVSGNGDAIAMYLDFPKFMEVFKTQAIKEGSAEDALKITNVMRELGLDDLKAVRGRIGFAGQDIVIDALYEIPQNRTGLFGAIKTIKPAMFDMVDSRAVNAIAVNVDLGVIYDTIMNACKAGMKTDDYLDMQKSIAEAESNVKFSIRNDLLASISGPAMIYSLRANAIQEAPSGGIVIIVKSQNPQSFEKAIKSFVEYAAVESEGKVQMSTQVQDGRTYNTVAMMPMAAMQIMPTWTVIDNNIVIGMNNPLCKVAASQMTSAGKGTAALGRTEDFKKATEKIPSNLIMLNYTNSKEQFNELMATLQQYWPMLTMTASQEWGMKLPFMLPNLNHITEQMGTSWGYGWFDNKGIRFNYRGAGFEKSIGIGGGSAIGMAILMPALAQTRQISQRVVSGSHLSDIGKTMINYMDDNNGVYPTDLKTLVEKTNLSPKSLESSRKPKDFNGPSFIYIPGQNGLMPPDNILVYENPEFCKDGVNVLFNDAHVEFMQPEGFRKALEKTYKRLNKPMPEIKFGQ